MLFVHSWASTMLVSAYIALQVRPKSPRNGGFLLCTLLLETISSFTEKKRLLSGASLNKKHRLNQSSVIVWGTNVKGWKTEPRLPPHLISATASQEVSQLSLRRIARLHQALCHKESLRFWKSGVTRHTFHHTSSSKYYI